MSKESYWVKRQRLEKERATNRKIKQTEKEIANQYKRVSKRLISQYEALYDKVLQTDKPTVNDIYRLARYWRLREQVNDELSKLGEKQSRTLEKGLIEHYIKIYNLSEIEDLDSFGTLDKKVIKQIINQPWLKDNKVYSERIWGNIEKLNQTLDKELINCVASGQKTSYLKKQLMGRFNVSHSQADILVRTEIAHVEVQASADRYKSYGLNKYQFWADPDERTCPVCGALHGKQFLYSEMQAGVNAPPLHPSCRCAILPVIDE